MNAITITPAGLRAALASLRKATNPDGDEGAYLAGGIDILVALLPERDAVPLRPPADTAPECRAFVSDGGATANPIDLPIDAEREEDAGRASPAAGEEASPMAPAPAPLPDTAAEGRPITGDGAVPQGDTPQKRGNQGDRASPVWPPERIAMLRERFPHESSSLELLADLNRIPADAEIASPAAIKTKAYSLGLRVSGETQARIAAETAATARAALARKRASDNSAPEHPATQAATARPGPIQSAADAIEPAPRRPTNGHPIPAEKTGDDQVKVEVFEAFDTGLSVRDVSAEFGIPLGNTLTNWHVEWKLKRRSAQATTPFAPGTGGGSTEG